MTEWILLGIIISTSFLTGVSAEQDPFHEYRERTRKTSPVYKAAKHTGYGGDSIQPYYVCDNTTSGSSMPMTAWHYSCKQSCTDENQKSQVNITRVAWHYTGADIATYKVSTNKVCYTSHENIWGYCTQSQTITPTATTLEDKKAIPAELFSHTGGVRGVKTIVNSGPAECDYLSDNTKCARDYVITYRPGKTSKHTDKSPVILNIYSDGIRTNPKSGYLIQNEVAWFWNPDDIGTEPSCGWVLKDSATCHFTNTSEVLSCPDIGYHYNIDTLKPEPTCAGAVYDAMGPAPFMYDSAELMKNRTTLTAEAIAGKGDPDINMIKGINAALEAIEESYCSSACDLFSRGHPADDDHVLDTPIGSWRMVGASTIQPLMTPCRPTEVWGISSPTVMCHGKDHILVSNKYTKETTSWDTTRDYIIVGETCGDATYKAGDGTYSLRSNMSMNLPLRFDFWTGDSAVMFPPYDHIVWENRSRSFARNPGWFSKVQFTPGMLHNRDDISSLLTTMASSTKDEIAYNKTSSRTIRTLFFDEVLTGAENVVGTVTGKIMAIIGGFPKILAMAFVVLILLYFVKYALKLYIQKSTLGAAATAAAHTVSFIDKNSHEMDDMMTPPPAPRKPRSRSRKLAREFETAGF